MRLVLNTAWRYFTGSRPGELHEDLAPRNYPAIRRLSIGNPGELLQRRPDVRSAERRLATATERQGFAVASLFPQVSVRDSWIPGGGVACFSPETLGHGPYHLVCRGLRSI